MRSRIRKAVLSCGLAAALIATTSSVGSASSESGVPVVSNIHEVSLNARGVGVSMGNYADTTLSRDGSVAVYRNGLEGPYLLAASTSGSAESPAPTPVVVTSTSAGTPGGSSPTSWSVTDDGSHVFFLEASAGTLATGPWSLIFVKDLTTGRLSSIRTPLVDPPGAPGVQQRLKTVAPVRSSGDGRRIAVTVQGTTFFGALVYDTTTATWTSLCPGWNCLLKALSPDGRYAVINDAVGQARIVDVDSGASRVLPDSPPAGLFTPFECLFTGDSQDTICTVQGGVPFGPSYVSTQVDVATQGVVRRVGFTSYGVVSTVDAHGDRWMIQVTRGGVGPSYYDPTDAWVLQASTGARYRLNLTPPDPSTGDQHRGNGPSFAAGISNDGHQVLFTARSTNLDPADRTGAWSAFAATLS